MPVTPSPSTAITRTDLVGAFEKFDIEGNELGYIAPLVFPVFETAKQSGNIGELPIESLNQEAETARASGSRYNEVSFKFGKSTFATEEHGVAVPVDRRNATLYRDYFDAEMVAARLARNIVRKNLEKRVAAAVFNASTWAGSGLTTSISTEWSTVGSATPITDVESAKVKVYDGCGLAPNALIINWRVWNKLKQCAQIIDRIKYSGIDDPKNVSMNAVAALMGLDRIIIAGGLKNSAKEGQAAVLADIWDDEYAMVARVATSNDLSEASIGRIFHWSEDGSTFGGTLESWYDEAIRGDWVRCRMETDEVTLFPQAGHLLSNIHA